MSLGRTYGIGLIGLEGRIVEVEADIGQSLPAFILLGLPDASLNESRDRVKSAAKNAGLPLSRRKITVNLMPADVHKRGSGFDLAIVMAALAAAGDVRGTGRTVFLAELGLDGRLRPLRGVLPAVMAAVDAGFPDVAVAEPNASEAALVPGARVRAFGSLAAVALAYGARADLLVFPPADDAWDTDIPESPSAAAVPDLADIAGQDEARFALEVAAAGAHHLLMTGPPGAGKTMLAERLPGLLPDLADTPAMEVTAVHSLGGRGASCTSLIRRPPFESPHHTATAAAVIGGGNGIPRPGAASRAHRGVLFLDEAPEFEGRVLDALRQPLENGQLVLHRAAGTAVYPARFQLVLAANPCPCGLASGKGTECTCTPQQRRRYFSRLSGPLLDRVDLQLEIRRISLQDFAAAGTAEPSEAVAGRVAQARERQADRLGQLGCETNSEVPGTVLRGALRPARSSTAALDRAMDRQTLTARGYDRVLRVAWSVADLAGHDSPDADDIGQALGFRQQAVAA
ncbi:YifB family Mg chelatase-like AAA ATPase [Arthrobacter sp. BL-252-APC-1A]|uniref:YifB family Mg chelatase-like AAA ATPase n=1 Tax=Arthrobacter sp. BL-252-APC-1A TaxID=2606622 RepID=UPI0012B1936B|nr:YifB family Mg chelatase-like AAA ATPase [Arthrobacter sp. BL-252-APC-1A]MSS00166.1 YifB family Mg chelatase-like AAA ATPase [Arthrobacter sp. BL-252-APC-1A]